MNLKHGQIIDVFENLKALKAKGIWFSETEYDETNIIPKPVHISGFSD